MGRHKKEEIENSEKNNKEKEIEITFKNINDVLGTVIPNEEILNKIIVNIKHTIISKINIIIFFFKSIPFNPL